jgi:TRAP-type C4-dicarboxylate transport system substrate-binding protein
MKRSQLIALILLGLAMFTVGAQTISLKMAVDAPRNSPWGLVLEKLAAEWRRVSANRVNLTVYAGTQGSEPQIIQKMRFGLDAGVFASTGLAHIYEDILALSIPSLIRDEAELQAAMAILDPAFRSGIESKGYTVVTYSYSGWIRLFTRRPVAKPADLNGLKVAIPGGNVKFTVMLQSVGAIPVQMDAQGFIGQIATGAIDAFMLSPALVQTQWSFLKAYIPFMTDMDIAPFMGAILMNTKSWQRIPENLRPPLLDAANRIAADMAAEINRLEAQSIRVMLADGLTAVRLTDADRAAWYEAFVSNRNRFLADQYSKEVIEAIDRVVKSRGGQ